MKRTQSSDYPIGAYFTPMEKFAPAIAQLVQTNHLKNATPERDDSLASQLWGELVTAAAAPLEGSAEARDAIAADIGIPRNELSGTAQDQARRLARELFTTDLDSLVRFATRLARLTTPFRAWQVFDAVAVCTSYRGEPWVAAEVAAELAAQVDVLASTAHASGRVLHLIAREADLRTVYLHRADQRRQ